MTKGLGGIRGIFTRMSGLLAIGTANIVSSAIIGIFWFYMARVMGPENYGNVSYFLSISAVASVLTILGTDNALVVNINKNEKVLAPLFFIVIVSTLIAAIVLYLLFSNIGVSLYVIGYGTFILVTMELLARKIYKKYSRYVITQKILLVALAVSLYHFIGPEGVILGYALSFFPFSINIYKEFKRSKIDISILKPHFGFMMSSYALSLSRTFSYSVDKLIISPLFGFVLLGNYQLGMQALTVLSLLPLTVFQYVLPHDATGNPNIKIKIVTVIITIFLSALIILLSPIVLPSLFPKFVHAIEIVQIMSFAIIPITVNSMLISRLLGNQKIKVVTIGSAITLFVQISGIIILGKIYGINGAAASLVLGSSLEMIYLIIMSRIIFKKSDNHHLPTNENN
ncbi:MAG: oligosaccharide flippase family protein [Nitrosotalea sp.]